MRHEGIRNIIEIDRERCNGCGQCVLDCAEGAIAIIDGKAAIGFGRLLRGLGACLSGCPQNACHRAGKPCRSTKATMRRRRQKEERGNSFSAARQARPHGTTRLRMLRGHRAGIRSWKRLGKARRQGRLVKKADMARQAAPCTAVRPVPQGRGYPACRRLFGPASARFARSRQEGRVDRLPKFEDNRNAPVWLRCLRGAPGLGDGPAHGVPCCRGIAAVCHEAAEECGISVRELVMGHAMGVVQMKD
ncbi:ATP-binding protein [Bilophila wadsworthia]|uniref:ATP-binding protein n=1 Tax=Bilophila wadsworthia TaxID=35833 RepID=UPI0039905FFE